MPRALVLILIVYVILIATVLVNGCVVVPSLVNQVQQIAHDAPQVRGRPTPQRDVPALQQPVLRHARSSVDDAPRRLPQLLGHLAGPLKDVTVQAASFIGQVTTVLAVSFLSFSTGVSTSIFGLALTGRRQKRYRKLIADVNKAVADYVLGNVVISVLATIATWIVLMVLGVPYALSLGFLVGFFDLIRSSVRRSVRSSSRWRP